MATLLEGAYKANDSFYTVLKNENGKVSASGQTGIEYPMIIEYGDFGEADPKVEKISGIETYNVKFIVRFPEGQREVEREGKDEEHKKIEFDFLGVIFDDGRKCSMKGFNGISGLIKITEDELDEIMKILIQSKLLLDHTRFS